jgi:(2R)-ethylmalonyl-CoA mutase
MIDEMKGRLVQAHAERVRRIESGDLQVVGVNSFTETEPSPLAKEAQAGGIVTIDPAVEREQTEAIQAWRAARDAAAVTAALDEVRRVAQTTENLVPATIAFAKAGGTVGEWAGALREVFGEYRAPTGVGGVRAQPNAEMEQVRERVREITKETGRPIKLLVAKPGLDGHSNGAEQIAVAARDAGIEVVYQGIRLTPAEIAAAARDEDVDVVGLSILSGSHLALVPETLKLLRAEGVDAPIVVGGIIPDADRAQLEAMGVARVYTPKDYRLAGIMRDMAELAATKRHTAQAEAAAGR